MCHLGSARHRQLSERQAGIMDVSIDIFEGDDDLTVRGSTTPEARVLGCWVSFNVGETGITLYGEVDWLESLIEKLHGEVARQRRTINAADSIATLAEDGTCTNPNCALCAAVRS